MLIAHLPVTNAVMQMKKGNNHDMAEHTRVPRRPHYIWLGFMKTREN